MRPKRDPDVNTTRDVTHLDEGDEQRRAELLLEDDAVVRALVAAGDERREEDEREARVRDVLEGKLAELLQHAGLLAGLNHVLKQKRRFVCALCTCMERRK